MSQSERTYRKWCHRGNEHIELDPHEPNREDDELSREQWQENAIRFLEESETN